MIIEEYNYSSYMDEDELPRESFFRIDKLNLVDNKNT